MKHRHKLPKRATAHSRAAKREPLAALKNPRPVPGTAPLAPRISHAPPLAASDWYDEFDVSDGPVDKRGNAVWYWTGAFALAALALVWWLS